MGKSFWIIVGVIIAASIGLIFLVSSGDDNGNSGSKTEILEIKDDDHTKGIENASVELVEYSDFQCPACGALFPIVDRVAKDFEDQITYAFRHFPIVSIHPNAMAAARAAEAAGYQDMFWEMHDIIFIRQNEWSPLTNAATVFEGYAAELGLDMDKYREDVVSEEASKTINSSVSTATSIGVNATPTYFINGEQIPTPQSVEEFSATIQAALDSANAQ